MSAMSAYYYLVSSLPNLNLESPNPKIDYDGINEMILKNLEEDDRTSFNYVLFPGDIQNLVKVICEKHGIEHPYPDFSQDCSVPLEIVEDFVNQEDQLPVFMQSVLEDHSENFAQLVSREIELILYKSLYESMENLPDGFLKNFFRFEFSLRNILAALNCRMLNKEVPSELIEDALTYEKLIKSSSQDFGLSGDVEFVSGLTDVFSSNDPVLLEKSIDKLRWNMIETLVSLQYFSSEIVFAYYLKLLIVKRWAMLDDDKGNERFKQIVESLSNKLELKQI